MPSVTVPIVVKSLDPKTVEFVRERIAQLREEWTGEAPDTIVTMPLHQYLNTLALFETFINALDSDHVTTTEETG